MMRMLRHVVVPLAAAYALFLGVVAVWWRRAVPRPGRGAGAPGSEGWVRLVRYVASTLAGGYAVFLLIVLVFHVWIVGQHGALASAIRGGAFLAFCVAAPAFMLLSWIDGRRPG